MYIPSQIDIASLIDAAETISTDDDIPEYISYRLLKEAQERLLLFGPDENAARLHDRISQIFVRLKVDQECPEKFKEMSLIEILVDIYLEYDYKNKIDRVEGSSEKSERFLTPSKVLTALKMLIRVERGDTKEEDTESDDGYFNITESSSTASTTDLQASRVNANMYIPSQIDIESLIDAARKACEEGLPEFISYRLFREAQQKLLDCGPDDAARLYDLICQIFVRLEVDEECPEKYEEMSLIEILVDIYLEYDYKNKIDRVEGSSETREKFLTTSKLLRTALKMLIRVERGDTSEEDFIREKGIPEEANMYIPSQIEIEYLIDAAEKAREEGLPEYISYRLLREAQQRLLIFGTDENAARLHHLISQGFVLLEVDLQCPKKYEKMSLIEILVDIYGEYDAKNENDGVEGSSETREKFLTTSKLLRTALKMLIRVERGDTSEEDFIREKRIPEEFVQDTKYDEGSYNFSEEDFIREKGIPEEFVQDTKYDEVFIESSSTAAATDLQASRVNWTKQLNAPLEEIDPEIANTIELERDRQSKTQLGLSAFRNFPSEWDIENLINVANVAALEADIYLPKYIPYRLLKEAEKTFENQIPVYYTQRLKAALDRSLSYIMDKGIPACPEGYKENDSTIQVFVRFYSKFNKDKKINQLCKDNEMQLSSIRKMSKALRSALKMLIRVERGKTSEEDFIRENEIPKEFLQDTHYDDCTNWLPIEANMDVPISKIDIEYLIDAAEKTSFDDDIPKYFPRLLYEEAYKALVRLELHQKCSLIGHIENNPDLAIKFRLVYSRIKGEGIHFPKRPEEYGKNDSTIKVLVEYYREYIKKKKIDELRKEDEKHKKWGILCQEFEARSAMREEILATYKAMRTALKMLCRVERGDTPEEVFIVQNGIPEEFLQDTEYDGSNETYNIIPFDGRPDLLPEVQEAIESLKLGLTGFTLRYQRLDVLDHLQKFFGFQEHSVKNQRENIVNLLSNEQMRPFTPGEHGTAIDKALDSVFNKSLGNYIKWCRYLSKDPIWKNMDDENRKKKRIVYISLYYLIWGEAANVRFLPECLCYIFHRMSGELHRKVVIRDSFIKRVIEPLYKVIAAEAEINKKRDTSHSKWRNYDDFNEYFWSPDCFRLGWPLKNSPFLKKPKNGSTAFGKTSFVERRTFLHLYHSFHRMWIFHVMMFEALVIFAFNDGELNLKTLTETLTVTYFLMKLIQSMFDIWLKYGGAYSKTSRIDVMQIVIRFIGFMSATLRICFSHMKCLREMTSSILGIYAAFKILFSILSHFLPKKYENSSVASLIKWINQEEYVGGGMNNDLTDIFRYMLFWLVTLGFNFAFTYDRLISPLVIPTRDINIHNMLAIGGLWAGVICAYIVGSHVSYNVTSAVVGTFVGHKDRLGNIKSLGDVHKHFNEIPTAFMDHLHIKIRESPLEYDQEDVKKLNAAEFSPFWNKIVMNLREEDYISDMEQYVLSMPENSGCIDVFQWPLFLLIGKVFLAIEIVKKCTTTTKVTTTTTYPILRGRGMGKSAANSTTTTTTANPFLGEIAAKSVSQKDLWDEILKDDVYMKSAVEECYHSVKFILHSVLKDEGKKWVEGIYEDIESSIARDGNLCPEFQLNKLESFVKVIYELTEILNIQEDADNRLIYSAEQALQKVIRHGFLGNKSFPWLNISVIWPEDPELRSQIKRLHFLLTTKSAAHVPRNCEARRRLEFFINSLFMSMPETMPVPKMLSFSVLTPYYEETVLYSLDELESSKDDGVALIDYLKNLYPDEWTNYCERMKKRYTDVDRDRDRYEYRLWASYRGQTLARTVRGTMYYQKALLLQAYREMLIAVGLGEDGQTSTSPVPDVPMDEDMLKSLEKRSSNGEILKHTFRIHLRGEKNYNPWKEYMIKMLELQTTTDFVDPKGESQVKYVRNYPQKWKKLDKKVKDWIMASLDDPLKNMVKEMKTAKELWETLKIFFTRDTDEISSVNVTEHVSIKLLNKDHYREWVSQMENFLQAKGMFGYINGKLKDPDPKGKSHLESVKIYSPRWKELDGQVKEWIRVSLSESMYDAVKDSETAEQMWDALKEIIGSQCLDYAKAHVDLKFTYVVSCQIYGKQKSEGKDVAADIAFLLKKNEGLRVAFIDEVNKEFYSKLVKADKNGKDMEVYSIKLPGDPILGEGKPENQNHAIVFTRGNAIQTIDMNQDNYFEETLKMRNLLEEFHREHVIRPPTILGIREHIFTGSASSLASFMSNQETGFVTLGQRVIANPLKVRMHYGHPDVFDRVFHITRGGISKASRGINISEDIYAGFNSTLRQGSVTHHEYIQVGKGRDVGFNQIATFEGKVAGGNGEQVLSRDLYRLGQRSDFFRMLSFYYTTVGYYFSSLLMVITLYILLYGNLIMALSGTRVPHALNDTDMAPEWFLMIVLLPAIYMLLVPYLEQGLEKAVESFLAMFFSLGSIFFAFSLGTRIHWFGRTIIHGGASYQATGRGFVLHHIKFSENYRLYSRSHFVKGMEVLFLLVVYCIYGFHSVRAIYNNLLLFGGLILSISWIVAPFLFDSSPFDLKKNSKDWEDWNNWLNRKTDEVKKIRIEDKVKESWEIWWTTELSHIRTTEGRVIETILSLRFFIFPLVVGYKLDMQGLKNSLSNCVIPWIFLVGILFAHEFFSNKKFSNNRVATIGALALAIAYYFAFGNMLAFTIAIITIVLGFISFFSNNRVATIGALAIAYYYSAFGGVLAFFIAIITTVWGFLSICVAWKPTLKRFSLWMPVKYLAWICDTRMPALPFNVIDSDECVALKRMLEIFSLWTPVTYLAWICDTGMGALMFKIANMFSQRSIKQYLLRNMFVHNVSELLHKSSPENAPQYGIGC